MRLTQPAGEPTVEFAGSHILSIQQFERADVEGYVGWLRDEIAARADDLTALTRDLIRIPTLNPPGKYYKRINDYLGARLVQRGFELTHVRAGKPMAISNPVLFLAADRELAERLPADGLHLSARRLRQPAHQQPLALQRQCGQAVGLVFHAQGSARAAQLRKAGRAPRRRRSPRCVRATTGTIHTAPRCVC